MCIRTKQAHAAVIELCKACDLKQGQIHLEADDMVALLAIIGQQFKSQIHRDAFEDACVAKCYDSLIYAEDCLQTAFEVSADYAEEALIHEANDFYNGDMNRARAA